MSLNLDRSVGSESLLDCTTERYSLLGDESAAAAVELGDTSSLVGKGEKVKPLRLFYSFELSAFGSLFGVDRRESTVVEAEHC